MPFTFLKKSKTPSSDYLKINKAAGNVSGSLTALRFRDKDTRQIVIYIPSLELTGYGATEEKAEIMINFSMDDYFQYLFTLTSKKLNAALETMGWKQNQLKNKEYSNVFLDIKGELKNFNAVADTVEKLTLVTSE